MGLDHRGEGGYLVIRKFPKMELAKIFFKSDLLKKLPRVPIRE